MAPPVTVGRGAGGSTPGRTRWRWRTTSSMERSRSNPMPITSHTTYSAGRLRRRPLAAPAARGGPRGGPAASPRAPAGGGPRGLTGGAPAPTQQVAVDRRDAFDRPPPRLVIGHPAARGGHQRGRQRDLAGAAAGEAHAEVGGAVQNPAGAATGGVPTPHAAREHAPPDEFLERGEPAPDSGPAGEKPLERVHSYRCKL